MKKLTSRMIAGPMLFSLILVLSLSCSGLPLVPQLAQRPLRISLEVAGFEFQYEVCEKKVLGICVKKKWTKDLYDLNDIAVRKQLRDMGFVATAPRKTP